MADNKFQTPEALARCLPMSRLQAVLSGKWKILILWYVAFYRVQRALERCCAAWTASPSPP